MSQHRSSLRFFLNSRNGIAPLMVALIPRFFTEYNFASGDKSRTDGRVGTFDQLFPTNHNKYGTADQLSWRNIHSVRAGSEFKLRPKIKASFDYLSHWLAEGADALYGENGAPAARFLGEDVNRHVGHEFDFVLQYAVSKTAHVRPGPLVSMGWKILAESDARRKFFLPLPLSDIQLLTSSEGIGRCD